MSKFLTLVASLGFVAAGCSSHMNNSSGQFERALADARSENALHASNCEQSDALGAMSSEMTRHETAMSGVFDEMSTGFGMMGQCYSGDPSSMQSMMSAMHGDETAHETRMHDATSLDAARAECKSHTSDVSQELDQMQAMLSQSGSGCMM